MEHWKNLSLENIVKVIDGVSYTEEWMDICGFEGWYMVSDFGRIKSIDHIIIRKNGVKFRQVERIKKQILCNGYLKIILFKQGVGISHWVHRLVATAFINNPDNRKTVNHIKGVKTDNIKWLLEWNTYSQNHIHARDVLGRDFATNLGNRGYLSPYSKKVHQIDVATGVIIKTWDSISDAQRAGVGKNISAVCTGKLLTSGGFKWEHA